MRLIKIHSSGRLQLVGPFLEASRPKYAILSHVWYNTDEEPTYQEMIVESTRMHKKKGYLKIKSCCEHARDEGYGFVWVDTVCIDKTSSAELSEAINSMFKWYKNAGVCLVYLHDLAPKAGSSFNPCKYFTRGWTLVCKQVPSRHTDRSLRFLGDTPPGEEDVCVPHSAHIAYCFNFRQELLAPGNVIFLNQRWKNIGTKISLVEDLHGATGIDRDTLLGSSIKRASVARRMSWAARRITSRPEDMAYCLMGMFDVNMPLLYGEGNKAFVRLQEAIIQRSTDQTIFAWTADPAVCTTSTGFLSLLAPSPACFQYSANFIPLGDATRSEEILITSRGITIQPFGYLGDHMILRCRDDRTHYLCSLPIFRLFPGDQYARVGLPARPALWKGTSHIKGRKTLVPHDVHDYDFDERNSIKYMEIVHQPGRVAGYRIRDTIPHINFDVSGTIRASPFENTACGGFICFEPMHEGGPDFIVALFASARDGFDIVKDEVCVLHVPDPPPSNFYEILEQWARTSDRYTPLRASLCSFPGFVDEYGSSSGLWKLGEQCWVRVMVNRDHPKRTDSIAVAHIFAGKDLQKAILEPEERVLREVREWTQ